MTAPSAVIPVQNSICSDVEMKGSLIFTGEMVFDGALTGGSIDGEKLVVGEHGRVQANISATFLTVQGHITGNVDISEKTVLEQSSSLHGDLATARLVMQEGATFFGGSKIGPKEKGQETKQAPSDTGTRDLPLN
jgi:cytoskeletal protein CcmA (bactofilin family)